MFSKSKIQKSLNTSLYLVFLAVMLSCSQQKASSMETITEFDLQGHRGARGLYPENTLKAFETALNYGMTTLELDLHYLADGQFIIFHDHALSPENSNIDPVRNLYGRQVHSLTAQDLPFIDVGTVDKPKFPDQKKLARTQPLLLSELLEQTQEWDEGVSFNIELKMSDIQKTDANLAEISDALVETIHRFDLQNRTTVQSFYLPFLATLKSAYPAQKISALYSPSRFQGAQMMIGLPANREAIIRETQNLKAEIISPHHLYCSPDFVSRCHALGIKVIPWTVNDTSRMQKLFNMGVDGIISDYPDQLFQQYQLWKKSLKFSKPSS